MRENNEVENNAVNLVGTVASELSFSHEVFGEGFFTFILKIERTSGQPDELPITISERLCNLDDLQIGTIIAVNGQLRTYNKHEENKNRLIISVFAKEIEFPEEFTASQNNQVELTGFICKQPMYRKTPLGREICDLLLAVNRPYGKSDYIPGIAWGRNARFAENLECGIKITVHGRLQSRTYNKKISETETEQRIAYELSISKLEVAEEVE